MTCCPFIQQSFVAASEVVIPFGDIQKAIYGAQPNVQVYYKEGSTYYLSDDMNQVRVTASQIIVNLGGPGTGFIKVF